MSYSLSPRSPLRTNSSASGEGALTHFSHFTRRPQAAAFVRLVTVYADWASFRSPSARPLARPTETAGGWVAESVTAKEAPLRVQKQKQINHLPQLLTSSLFNSLFLSRDLPKCSNGGGGDWYCHLFLNTISGAETQIANAN